jgi:rare lipoprotein A
VTNLDNGKSALIRVNDRGPFARSRILDLSKGAAAKLGVIRTGTAKVRVQFLEPETKLYVQNVSKGVQYAMNSVEHMQGAPEYAPTGEPQTVLVSDMRSAPPPIIQTAPLAPAAPATTAPAGPDIFSVVEDSNPPTASYNPPPIAAGGNSYFIQAGTFSVADNADTLLGKLDAFDGAQVMEIIKGDKKFYRVMIGPYNTQESAKKVLSQLAQSGISGARIIRN